MNINQTYYKTIYDDVFCKTYSQSCYVFLCGGANKNNIRDNVRIILEQQNYQILYPEDLFSDLLNRNKSADLFEYENLLATNADIVCVICESAGALTELGVFVQNESISAKMVAAVDTKYSRQKSFIMQGPIKHLRKTNAKRVIVYKSDELEAFCKNLTSSFKNIQKNYSKSHKSISINTLSGYIAFIPIVLYFYKNIARKELHSEIKSLLSEKQTSTSNFNDLFNAAVKYLLKSRMLIANYDMTLNDEILYLSDKGYNLTKNTLDKSYQSDRTILHDRIRLGIIKEQLNN